MIIRNIADKWEPDLPSSISHFLLLPESGSILKEGERGFQAIEACENDLGHPMGVDVREKEANGEVAHRCSGAL